MLKTAYLVAAGTGWPVDGLPMQAFSMNMPFAALVAHGYTNPNPSPALTPP